MGCYPCVSTFKGFPIVENVISKDSPDDMLVMYKGQQVELIVPIAERAVEIHLYRREFVMGDLQAEGYIRSIVALSKEVPAFEAEFVEFMKKDRLADPRFTPIRFLRNCLLAITLCESHRNTHISEALRLMFREIYLAASRNTLDTDFRIELIPQVGKHGAAS